MVRILDPDLIVLGLDLFEKQHSIDTKLYEKPIKLDFVFDNTPRGMWGDKFAAFDEHIPRIISILGNSNVRCRYFIGVGTEVLRIQLSDPHGGVYSESCNTRYTHEFLSRVVAPVFPDRNEEKALIHYYSTYGRQSPTAVMYLSSGTLDGDWYPRRGIFNRKPFQSERNLKALKNSPTFTYFYGFPDAEQYPALLSFPDGVTRLRFDDARVRKDLEDFFMSFGDDITPKQELRVNH